MQRTNVTRASGGETYPSIQDRSRALSIHRGGGSAVSTRAHPDNEHKPLQARAALLISVSQIFAEETSAEARRKRARNAVKERIRWLYRLYKHVHTGYKALRSTLLAPI